MIESIKTSLNYADVAEKEDVWQQFYDLETRLVAMTTHDIVPPDDKKDISKMKPAHKITPLSIPKFSGKIEHWRAFWDEFDHAVNRRGDLEKLTKLIYLKQAIQDFSLKTTISDLGVSEEAYPAAIELLQNRFDKPRILHRQNCEAMIKISSCDNTRTELNELADKAQRVLTGFERLKSLDVSQAVTSIIELTMNKELKNEWFKATKDLKTTPPAADLITFIRERVDQAQEAEGAAAARISGSRNRQKPKGRASHAAVSNPVPAVVTTPAVVTSPANQPSQNRGAPVSARGNYPMCKYQCPLCTEKHYPYHCSVFRGFSVQQRLAHVSTNKLCITCLKPGHDVGNCHSTYKCKVCRAIHNSLLHEETTAAATPTISTNSATSRRTDTLKSTLLMTARVLLTGTNGLTLSARAFLDGGSNISIVSYSTKNTLALRTTGNNVRIDGVGSISTNEPSPLANITISSNYRKNWERELVVAVMPRPTRDIPIQPASDTRSLSHLQGLILADQDYDQPGTVDILLGQDVWDDIFLDGRIKGPRGTPSAWHSVFGWVISGLHEPDHTPSSLAASAQVVASTAANIVSDNLITKFWYLEEPPKSDKVFTPEEKRVESHYDHTHRYIEEEGRYEVTLPRTLASKTLGNSKDQALSRVKGNEKSIIRKGRYEPFQSVMAEYLEMGHSKPVSEENKTLPDSDVYYMPVHSVIKESSTSTKIRAVFDASAVSTTGTSFNDLLAEGPTLQPTLTHTLMKFRLHHVAVTGDISKMYREILLCKKDKAMHRYFWRKEVGGAWEEF